MLTGDRTILGLQRLLDDAKGPLLAYGKHLLHLNEFHDLLILNGISFFLYSNSVSCFPHVEGASLMDYILANEDMLQYIH